MTKYTIKELSKTKQPRERLSAFGVENLTEIELIAIILSSGTKKKNVLSVAKEILKKYPLDTFSSIQSTNLAEVDGVGPVKAGKIVAGIELAKRAMGHHSHIQLL